MAARTELWTGSNLPSSAPAAFPKPQGSSSPQPAQPFPTSRHKKGVPAGRAGQGWSPAPACALACPRSASSPPHSPAEAVGRPAGAAPSRPRLRRALAQGRSSRSAPSTPRGAPERALGSALEAPPRPAPRRRNCPAQRRGPRCGRHGNMEPGVGGAAGAEVESWWRREARVGSHPQLYTHLGPCRPCLGTLSGRPRPVVLSFPVPSP